MNENILNTGIQEFISKNIATDTVSILLKKPFFKTVSNQELAEQLEAKKKCQKKLPTYFNTPNIYYPNKLNIEQTSSEITAQYKADLVDGKTLIDLTGGLGIDSYFFSKKIDQVFHCEVNPNLSQIASHNFNILGVENIATYHKDGISFLASQKQHFDWIYVDPSRRNDLKGKVFQLADCIPNVASHLHMFFEKSDNILIKTSPLLDISKGISELQYVYQIHIIAVDNEVKELLWVLKKGFSGEIELKTINIQKAAKQKFDFKLLDEKNSISKHAMPCSFIYEPNAAIMKSGAFKTLSSFFKLFKIHINTHLYTAERLIEFPGRRFKVIAALPFNGKTMKNLAVKKANITTRNFPISVAGLRKKYQIKDGGEVFLFFVTNKDENLSVIQCEKL